MLQSNAKLNCGCQRDSYLPICYKEVSDQSSGFASGYDPTGRSQLRPDRVTYYDVTLSRLDSEALRLLQRWGYHNI